MEVHNPQVAYVVQWCASPTVVCHQPYWGTYDRRVVRIGDDELVLATNGQVFGPSPVHKRRRVQVGRHYKEYADAVDYLLEYQWRVFVDFVFKLGAIPGHMTPEGLTMVRKQLEGK